MRFMGLLRAPVGYEDCVVVRIVVEEWGRRPKAA